MQGVHIKNERELNSKIVAMKKQGVSSLHIVSDFDGTLTKGFFEGKKIGSSYAALRDGTYLGKEFSEKAKELFRIYYPYEKSLELSREEKVAKMDEWWQAGYGLMMRHGISRQVIVDIVNKKEIYARLGFDDFFSLLSSHTIPLLVFSAGQGNIIKEFLHTQDKLLPNVHIISNFFEFDAQGKAIGYSQPFIHPFNKNEVVIKQTSYYEEIVQRKNVLLLGDNLADLDMSEGIGHNNIVKIGFLNDNKEKFLEEYKKQFDVVITDDGHLDYVNELLEKIID